MTRVIRARPAALLAGLILCAAPAAAQNGTDITIDDSSVIVDAAYPGSLTVTDSPGMPYTGPQLRCAYFELVIGGSAVIDLVATAPIEGDTYLWYCWEPGRHPILEPYSPTYPVVLVYSPTVNPGGEALTAPDAAQYATDRIDFETPTVALSPATDHIVGVPTWLAVTSRLDYPTVSASAGPVWATVRAEFRRATWQMGNGDVVECTTDATTVWAAAGGPEGSACTYTFESGDSEPFVGEASVTWAIWQRSNDNPTTWAFFADVSVSAPVPFAVTELQAAIG